MSELKTQRLADAEAMPTLAHIVPFHAARRPHALAAEFEGAVINWAELERRTRQVANALRSAGVRRGARIAYAGKNSSEFYELLFGAACAGIVVVPTIWRLAAAELAAITRDAEADILFVGDDQAEALAALRTELQPDLKIIALGAGLPGVDRFAEWRERAPDLPAADAPEPSAPALQLYTSGTTGVPKGVIISHSNILAGRREALKHDMDWNEWSEDDVNLVAMPMGHIAGVGWGLVGFFNGARNVILREFDPVKVLDAIATRGVSKVFFVPTALQILLAQPNVRTVDYSRLRHILYGASPIALDLLRECTEVFGCGFCQQYGMTETTGTVVYLPPEDHDPAGTPRMKGAGKPLPGVELRIVGADRTPLLPYQTGEIETRSASNMIGYWRKPNQTALTISADGWLRTGDAGYLDEDGYLYIQDRYKDMIVTGGENVYPAEVESAIYGHPAVQAVAVIGVPDEKWGEAVKAIVVRRPGSEARADEIIAFAKTRIAGFKVPKTIEFVDSLPLSATGKVLKRVLRAPFWEGHTRQVN